MIDETPERLLECIRYEFRLGKQVFDAYKNFCAILGNDAMTYQDFDYWFYQFSNGKMDLESERSSKKQLELSDMPDDMLGEILENLEWAERSILRRTSKAYRDAVDTHPYVFNDVIMYSKHGLCHRQGNKIMTIGEQDIILEPAFRETHHSVRCGEKRKRIRHKETFSFPIDELFLVLINPKAKIMNLKLYFDKTTCLEKLRGTLKSLSHQIHVESLQMTICIDPREFGEPNFRRAASDSDSDSDTDEIPEEKPYEDVETRVLHVLAHMKPGKLQLIDLSIEPEILNYRAIKMNELAKTEQWKRAKQFKTNFKASLSVEDLIHFDYLDTTIETITAEDVIRLRDQFSNSPNFEYCRIRSSIENENAMKDMDVTVGSIQMKISRHQVVFKKI